MLYRAVAIFIVVFWLTMTGLLLRQEFALGATALREVPVSHVVKLMFLHEQQSNLHLYNERQRVGQLVIHPKVRKEDETRQLDFSGSVLLAMPGLARQRVTWGGGLEMNRALEVRLAQLDFSFREPQGYAVKVIVEPELKRLRYETRSGDRPLERGEYALDEQGALTWLREQGIDPALIQRMHKADGPQPSIKAWQSSLQVQGHKLDTYRVALEHGGQTLLEFQVDHLGYILEAKTFLGYTAAPD